MNAWDAVDAIARTLGYLSLLGFLAILTVWAAYAIEGRVRRPNGARFVVQCVVCRHDYTVTCRDAAEVIAHLHDDAPTCRACTDTLARLDQEARS